MKWIIKRLLILCGTLSLMCTTVIVLGRLDHSPSKLQAYGLDVCDGQPCFRGLKPGLGLAKVMELFPDIVIERTTAKIPSTITGFNQVYISLDQFGDFVKAIVIDTRNIEGSMMFSAGDVIALFGMPCRVYLWYIDSVQGYSGNAILFYPTMSVAFNVTGELGLWHNFRLDLSSPVEAIIYGRGSCYQPADDALGPWRGFTSFVIYRERNLRDIGIQAPPN